MASAHQEHPVAQASKSRLERLLGLVTEVQPGEAATALTLALNIFLLLSAYYLVKPVREALILASSSGPETKAYLSGAIAVGLLFAVPMYRVFAARLPRNRLVVSVTLFFASHLLIFYALSFSFGTQKWLGLLFYLWLGVFNMMVVAQAWAFAADIYSQEQGARLFALIGVGASLGAALGSLVGVVLSTYLGVFFMLPVAAAVLVLFCILTEIVHRRAGLDRPAVERWPHAPKEDRPKGPGVFAQVFQSRYLSAIALFSVLLSLVNTNGEYMLGRLVSDLAASLENAGELPGEMTRAAYIGAWYGEFYLYVNLLGVLLQLAVVSRLIKRAGFKVAFLILPVVAWIDVSLIAVLPIMSLVMAGKIVENATDCSLNNTVRHMLWLPTSRSVKYQAKQTIDAFFVRFGDVASALLVAGLVGLLGFDLHAFAGVGVLFVGFWVMAARRVLRERNLLLAGVASEKPLRQPVYIPSTDFL